MFKLCSPAIALASPDSIHDVKQGYLTLPILALLIQSKRNTYPRGSYLVLVSDVVIVLFFFTSGIFSLHDPEPSTV